MNTVFLAEQLTKRVIWKNIGDVTTFDSLWAFWGWLQFIHTSIYLYDVSLMTRFSG